VSRWVPIALIASGAVVFASQFLSLHVLVDDAWISFSYSKNLATGHGLTFSHGARVEGYSNFLWTVLTAIPLAIAPRASALAAARWLCLPFAVLLGWAEYVMVHRVTRSRVAGGLSVLLLATCSDLASAVLSGLESFAYASLVSAGFALLVISHEKPRAWRLAAAAFAAVALTRIDGFLPLGFALLWQGVRALRADRAVRKDYLVWAGAALSIFAIWFLWRWRYYGLVLPSTYYAKELIPQLLPLRGREYVVSELAGSRLWVASAGAAVLLWRRRRLALSLLVFALVQIGYAAQVGGDWMPFGRFVLPVVPLMVALLVAGAAEAVRLAWRLGARTGVPVSLAAASAVALVGLGLDHRVVNSREEDDKLALQKDQVDHVRGLVKAARLLDKALYPGARLVTDYAGAFGYFTHASVIDMWGLVTPEIAVNGGTDGINPIYGRTCPSCYPGLGPQFFHVMQPIVRRPDAFASARQVIDNVWQTSSIGRFIDFDARFAVGRVTRLEAQECVWFLQARDARFSAEPRTVEPGILVEYPFEPR
jgi:hypothetical protein